MRSGCQLITIHGRTRGSAKNRRAGPADLKAVSEVSEYLRTLNIPVVSNGNIRCAHDIRSAQACTPSCLGVMSAEGILRNPSIFYTFLKMGVRETSEAGPQFENNVPDTSTADDFFSCRRCSYINREESVPDLFSLFEEYCMLSERYRLMGGWDGMNAYEQSKRGESKQLYIARQHLVWMLGKSGHGRTVRYHHLGDCYKKHVQLLNDLTSTSTMDKLVDIARKCLMGKS